MPTRLPKISIVVFGSANESDYRCCLDSLVGQSEVDIEILLPTDNALASTARYQVNYPDRDLRIKEFNVPVDASPANTRQIGLANAIGEYILFIDARDRLHADACRTLFEVATTSKAEIVHFGATILCQANDFLTHQIREHLKPYPGIILGPDILISGYRRHSHGFSMANKLFSRSLCQRALLEQCGSKWHDVSDYFQYFALCFFSCSYFGASEHKFYFYNLDSSRRSDGVFGGWAQFEQSCSMSRDVNAIKEFLAQHSTGSEFQDLREAASDFALTLCADHWEHLKEADAAAGFDLLLQRWPAVDVISALARRYFDEPDELAHRVLGADALRRRPRPIRTIGVYCNRMRNGGTERVISILAPMWLSLGYSVVLFTGEDSSDEDYAIPAEIQRVILPDFRKVERGTIRDRCVAVQEALQRFEIDVFVHNCAIEPRLIYDLLIVKTVGIPFVISNHETFSRSLLHLDDASFRGIPVFALADKMTVLSSSEEYLWELFDVRAIYIPNPQPFNIEDVAVSKLSSNNVIWVGRLSLEKNYIDAVDIFHEVLAHVPDAQLFIVGAGENSSAIEELKKKIERLGLIENVNLCGYVADVEYFYRAAAAMISTSSTESFSLTLLEGKAHGVPCVLYDMPNLELPKDQRGVVIVRQGDKRSAAQALIRLLRVPDYRKVMGQEARLSAEDFSASTNVSEAWGRLFRELELCCEVAHSAPGGRSLARINFEVIFSLAKRGVEFFRTEFVPVGKLKAAQEERDAVIATCTQILDTLRNELDGNISQARVRAVLRRSDRLIRQNKALYHELRAKQTRSVNDAGLMIDALGLNTGPLLLATLPARLRSEEGLRIAARDGWARILLRRPFAIREWWTVWRIERWISKKNVRLDEAGFLDIVLAALPHRLRSVNAISLAVSGEPSWKSAFFRFPADVGYWQALRRIQRASRRSKEIRRNHPTRA